MKFIKKHIFLTYAFCVLILNFILSYSGASYDDGGIVSFLLITTPIWGIVYWVPSEILFILNDGSALKWHGSMAVGIGIICCVGLDHIRLYFTRKNND